MSIPEEKQDAAARGMLHAWWAARIPERPALVTSNGDLTYAELNDQINRLSRALRSRALQAGDAIALMCTNEPAFLVALYAAQRIGLRFTPVNWHLTGNEAAYIVENCQAKAFVCSGSLGDKVGVAAAAGGPSLVRINTGGQISGFEMYDEVLAAEEGSNINDPVIGTQMLYTSGTTGRPKGVHRIMATESVLTSLNFCGYDEDYEKSVDAHLLTGPLYHAAPLSFSVAIPFSYGTPIVMMDHWDPVEALLLIEQHGITHTHMVPTMFHRLLALPEETRARADTSSLRFVIHGAAPCPVRIKQRLIAWLGPVVVEYYAATEGLGTLVDSETWVAHPGTVGKPMSPGLVKVADDAGNELPPGQVGIIFLQAPPSTTFDYYGDHAKTADVFRGDYFTLGDMGYMDPENFLYLTDRTANLIISGGVNIYPAEVDAVLLEHPAVGDAATIGVPDDEWGEVVKAVIQPAEGVVGTKELGTELIAFCRARLAHFKCPRSVDFAAELPREDTGKIFKRKLREQYREASNPT